MDDKVQDEIIEESGRLDLGKKDSQGGGDKPIITNDILNPFVHRLELESTYDKLKVRNYMYIKFS